MMEFQVKFQTIVTVFFFKPRAEKMKMVREDREDSPSIPK